jgi:hypothetical protein
MKQLLYIALIATLLLSACSKSPIEISLNNIEQIMDSIPDSALSRLSQINQSNLTSEREHALYALLYSQALDKNYIIISNDSLIHTAVDYYKSTNDHRHYMMSLYYLCVSLRDNAKYAKCAYTAMTGLDVANELNDKYYAARFNEVISDVYALTFGKKNEIRFSREAIRLYKESGHIPNYLYALVDLSVAYCNNRKDKEALQVLDSVAAMPINDETLRKYIIQSRIRPLIYLNHCDSVKQLIDTKQYEPDSTVLNQCLDMCEVYRQLDDLTNMKIWLDRANAIDSLNNNTLFMQSAYHEARKEYAEALRLMHEGFQNYDKDIAVALRQLVSESFIDYNKEKICKKDALNHNYFLSIITLIIFIIILSIAYLAYYREYKKRKQLEIERNLDNIKYLNYTLQSYQNDIADLSQKLDKTQTIVNKQANTIATNNDNLLRAKSKITELFRDKFSTLNSLCDEYYEKRDIRNDILTSSIYNSVLEKINEIRSDKFYSSLECIVNENLDNIISKLRQQAGDNLKEEDFRFITYICAGFSARAVCLFTNLQKSNFYAKRTRLKSKILKLNLPDNDLFISAMS